MNKQNQPWTIEDLVILAMTVPTKNNRKMLAKSLGRTEDAIQSQWYLMYSAKSYLRNEDGTMQEQYKRICKAREIVGLTVAIGR